MIMLDLADLLRIAGRVIAPDFAVGTHTGRVAIRASGSFNITTAAGTVTDIRHTRCVLLQRANGWTWHTQPAANPITATGQAAAA